MLKRFLLIASFLGSVSGFAQGSDLPAARPIIKGQDPNLGSKSSDKGSLLRMPSVIDSNLIKRDKEINMMRNSSLKQAGFDLVLDPKIAQNENSGSHLPSGDMYLGDVKTTSDTVGIAIRDHGEVDGDRVLILVNEQVVEYNALLTGRFQSLTVTLKEGFNTIEFRALNQGYAGLNTAQLIVVDQDGEALQNKSWFLSTGSKATVIVVKKPTLE